jgi:hypothetical protein
MNNGYRDKYEQKGTEENSPAGNQKDNIENGEKKMSGYNPIPTITNSYFCFECGAIMTTKEDKKQHELIEMGKKTGGSEDLP